MIRGKPLVMRGQTGAHIADIRTMLATLPAHTYSRIILSVGGNDFSDGDVTPQDV